MSEEHEEHAGPIHQATWVPGLTVGVCVAFVALMVLIRIFVAADLGSAM